MKKSNKGLIAAREARKPNILFDCEKYTITRIPLNLRIDIKQVMRPQRKWAGIDRDIYCKPSDGLEYAKELANWWMKEEFVYNSSEYYSFQTNNNLKKV